AGWPHDGDELAGRDAQRHSVERSRLHLARAEDFAEVVELEHYVYSRRSIRSISMYEVYAEVITRSPGSSPSSTSKDSGLRRPSRRLRLTAKSPDSSSTNAQLPPVSWKNPPRGSSSASEESPSATRIW